MRSNASIDCHRHPLSNSTQIYGDHFQLLNATSKKFERENEETKKNKLFFGSTEQVKKLDRVPD